MTEEQTEYEYRFIMIEGNQQLQNYQDDGWIMPRDLDSISPCYKTGNIIEIKRKIKSGTAQ